MKLNERKFNEIKSLLKSKLGENIISYEEYGTEFIEIKETKFWLTIDDKELTVGYGLFHTHFSEDYGNLYEGIFQVFDLLINRVKTTDFIKGDLIFKTIIEIEYPNSELINIGSTSILFFPFWKRTKIETYFTEPIINRKEIEKEVNVIVN